MRSLLLIFLFTLVACDFEQNVFNFASCALKSEKLRENLPKVIEALKTGDFSEILSIGLTAFAEVKKEILECVNDDEPELLAPNCKNPTTYSICCNACRITDRNSYRQCQQNCYRRWCY